ncbi:hypothetical protein ACHAXR_000704, partial [Thalassiosira sp. AJA248-18]
PSSKNDPSIFRRAARELLLAQEVRNGQLEEDLVQFAARRETYASYCIAKIPGNRGLKGNACSEQNHASVLMYVNDGNRHGNNFCEHPIVFIKELMQRQQKHVKKTNARLFGMSQKMRVECARLRLLPATPENKDLLCAGMKLNLVTYDRYKRFKKRADTDLLLETSFDATTQKTYSTV